MFQRTYIAGVTREDIMEALVSAGEDPTVSRVDAVRKRLDPFLGLSDYRSAVVKAAVEQARRELASESDSAPAKPLASQPSVANAIAALQLAVSSDGAVNIAACNEALAQLLAVRGRVEALDRGLNDRETAPTGDSYNDLFDLVGVRDDGVVLAVSNVAADPGPESEKVSLAQLNDFLGASGLPFGLGREYEVATYEGSGQLVPIWNPAILAGYQGAAGPASYGTLQFKSLNSSSTFAVRVDEIETRVRENGQAMRLGAADDTPSLPSH